MNSKWFKILKIFSKHFRSKPTVAVINLHGVITTSKGLGRSGLCFESIKGTIDRAFALPKLSAIALSVNSPGGSPVQSELIYNYIRQLAREKNIQVYSFIEDVGASGGYWLACTGDEIYASSNSIVGSIGVISAGFGFVDAIRKLGIERRLYTQGKNKSILDPFTPEKESDVKIIHSIQRDIHNNFKSLVLTRREQSLKASEAVLFNGEFWSGTKALELGLIDRIGDMYTVIKEKYGKHCKIIRINSEKTWLKRTLGLEVSTENIVANLLTAIEEKVIFSKLGL